MSSLLLAHCRLLATMNDEGDEISGAYVVVEDGWITAIGTERPSRAFDSEIDCSKFLAIPGLINTHHHLYQTLTRGFPQSDGKTLFAWLQMLYPIWAGLDEEMIHASTRAGLSELALSGCTTCADHLYVFPEGSENFMDAQIEAARSVGLRFHATRGSMDLGQSKGGLPPDSVVQPRDVILQDSERVVNRYHDPKPGAMVKVGLAPCSPFSASPELMLETAGLARELGVRLHTHLAETQDEANFSRKKLGVSPVELLDRVSWLEEDVWLAHCVHLTDSEISTFAERHASVTHCPTSNMLLASGLAPVKKLLEKNVTVGLAVDGSASNDSNDLRQEVKQALVTSRVRDGVPGLSARDALRLATRGSAACLGRSDIGSIEVGKAADIALFDTETLEFAGGEEDLVATLVLGAAKVDTVLVHGESVVVHRELTKTDSSPAAIQNSEAARRLRQRFQKGS